MNKSEELKRNRYYTNPFSLPPECDPLCLIRKCFNKYENKGSFSQGRGYTSYYKDFRPVCGTRMCHGCPNTRNKPDEILDIDKAKELLKLKPVPMKIRKALTQVINPLTRNQS